MSTRNNKAFSLQEMLIVIAIIAVMTVILVTSGLSLRKQADIRATKNTLVTLSVALDKYHENYGQYPFEAAPYLPDAVDIGYTWESLQPDPNPDDDRWVNREPRDKDDNNDDLANYQASIQALYRKLNDYPETAEILGSISDSFKTAKNSDGDIISLDGQPLVRIVDSWGNPLRYVYEDGNGVAVVESAGSDGLFGRKLAGDDAAEDEKNLDNISY